MRARHQSARRLQKAATAQAQPLPTPQIQTRPPNQPANSRRGHSEEPIEHHLPPTLRSPRRQTQRPILHIQQRWVIE